MFLAINSYGDFDVKHTNIFLESPQKDCDIKSILNSFYNDSGMSKDLTNSFETGQKNKPKITKDGIFNIKKGNLYTELLIDYLIKHGFKKIKYNEIIISDWS